jgi:hypothetical protein
LLYIILVSKKQTNMKIFFPTRQIIYGAFVIGIGLISISGITNTGGPGAGYTGAPSEGTCTTCHGGTAVTTGTNWDRIKLETIFSGNGYLPDSTYDMTITVRHPGIFKYGFQVVPLFASSNFPAGEISNSSGRVQRYTRNVSGRTREYAGHTSSGTAPISSDSTAWTFQWKAPSSNQGNVVFYLAVNSTNNNNNSSGDVTYTKTFTIRPSDLIPKATASAVDTVVCANTPLAFSGNGTAGATNYEWTFPQGNPSTATTQNPSVRFNTAGTQIAILRVSNNKARSEPDTFHFRVLEAPTSSIVGANSRTICEGDSIVLQANRVTNATYSWQPGNIAADSLWVSQPGQYRVTTTLPNGCATVSNAFFLSTVAIPNKPVLSVQSGNMEACQLLDDTLLITNTTANTYVWNINGSNQSTTAPKLSVKQSNTFTVFARAQNISACPSPFSDTLTIKVTPRITVTPRVDQVTTDMVTLQWTATVPDMDYAVSKDGGLTFTNPFKDLQYMDTGLQPNTVYSYTVRTFQDAPCFFYDTTITATTLPCSDLRFGLDFVEPVCKGDSFKLTVTGLSQAFYGISFNGGMMTKDTVWTLLPDLSGSVDIQIVDSNALNCPVIRRNIPYRVVTPYEDFILKEEVQHLCEGESYMHEISPGFDSLMLGLNRMIVAMGYTQNTYLFEAPGNGSVISTTVYNGPCMTVLPQITLNVTPLPSAAFTFERGYKTYQFTPQDTMADRYRWTVEGVMVSEDKFPVITFDVMDRQIEVSLETTNGDRCSDSSQQQITLPDVSSVGILNSKEIKVMPNPFLDDLMILNPRGISFEYHLYDALGREVIQGKSMGEEVKCVTERLSAGVYRLMLQFEGERSVISVIKRM